MSRKGVVVTSTPAGEVRCNRCGVCVSASSFEVPPTPEFIRDLRQSHLRHHEGAE